MKKKLIVYFIIVSVVLLSITAVFGFYFLEKFSHTQIRVNESNQLFELKRGTSITGFVKQIEQASLVDDAYLIPYLMKIKPSLHGIKSGTYQLSSAMTVETFLQLLVSGKEVQFQIKFVEGKPAKDWLVTLASTADLEYKLTGLPLTQIAQMLGIDGSLEGWLYPDTYSYIKNDSDLAILKRAYQKMQTALQSVWDNRDEGLPYKTPYELLIMASIIEKETGLDNERAKVASVFINRLKYNMLLQTDPTVIYGMGDNYNGRLFTKNLRDKNNPFNTYVISGLPPTPIAMPSLASLEAAAHPEQTNYLYFVANGDGGHTFTTNYDNHKQAVDKYRQFIRKRGTNNVAK
ncbi:endolytic transglycosylase MltG [Orbus sturtevantii]|uniref:endolytic transglycosylase MltG n=1 Tax=Orbus sturtevantii TaxID=3074109 RepID=UPI00370D8EF1